MLHSVMGRPGCGAAQLGGGPGQGVPGAGPFSGYTALFYSSLVCSTCSGSDTGPAPLCSGEMFRVPAAGRGARLPSLAGRESELPELDGSCLSVLMQMRTPNLHSLIGPEGTVLIGQNGAAVIDW